MNRLFPEGRLFSYSFYGFSLVNMAVSDAEDSDFREHARRELERIIYVVEDMADAPRFQSARRLVPKGGIIPAGQANLLRAGYALLGGSRADIIDSFHDMSALLYDEFMKSRVVSLETCPSMIWPVDNACALESLRLHDVLYGTKYAKACSRWAEWMASHVDAESGMMVAQVSNDGVVLDGPRGCALSWSLALMPGFAPELARSQYERYRSAWFIHVLGITGIREWSPGKRGQIDADTGPVLFDIGAAASGIGIAAAKANGDTPNLTRMLRGMELLSLPVWTPHGKHYFLGRVLLADELALWGKTICVWDGPTTGNPDRFPPGPAAWPFWLVYAAVFAVSALVLFLNARATARVLKAVCQNPSRWRRRHIAVLAFHSAAIIVWLIFLPCYSWFLVVLLAGTGDILERRFFTSA